MQVQKCALSLPKWVQSMHSVTGPHSDSQNGEFPEIVNGIDNNQISSVLSRTVRTVRYGTYGTRAADRTISNFLDSFSKPFIHASFKNAAQNNLKLRVACPSL